MPLQFLFLIFLLTICLLVSVALGDDCDQYCECTEIAGIVVDATCDSEEHILTSFPSVPDTVTSIWIESQQIHSLSMDDLNHYPHLQSLNILDSRLQHIDSDAFTSTPELTYIDFSENSLVNIPLVSNLPFLMDLILNHNDIESLPLELLNGLEYFEHFSAYENKISEIPQGVFKNLPNLIEINLSFNQISEIQLLAFYGLPRLATLHLNSNSLTQLPDDIFSDVPLLHFVYLSHNSLTSLQPYTFSSLLSLKILDLSQNSFDAFPAGLFYGLQYLTTFDATNNPFTSTPLSTYSSATNPLNCHFSCWLCNAAGPTGCTECFSEIPPLGDGTCATSSSASVSATQTSITPQNNSDDESSNIIVIAAAAAGGLLLLSLLLLLLAMRRRRHRNSETLQNADSHIPLRETRSSSKESDVLPPMKTLLPSQSSKPDSSDKSPAIYSDVHRTANHNGSNQYAAIGSKSNYDKLSPSTDNYSQILNPPAGYAKPASSSTISQPGNDYHQSPSGNAIQYAEPYLSQQPQYTTPKF